MLTYEEFKEMVMLGLQELTPQAYVLEVSKQMKNNEALDIVALRKMKENEPTIAPVMYFKEWYSYYQADTTILHDIPSMMMKYLEKAYEKEIPQMQGNLELESVKSNIIAVLVSEKSSTLYENIPTIPFEDLTIMFKWVLKIKEEGINTTIVTNEFMKSLDLNVQQLYELAKENTKRIMPPSIRSMNSIVQEFANQLKETLAEEFMEQMLPPIPDEKPMFVISNEQKTSGAFSIMYEEVLDELAENLQSDLYILPSSIHETIAVSCEHVILGELQEIVKQTNEEVVDISERLSNHVYMYDRIAKTLKIAEVVPNKEMEQIISEVKKSSR